MDAVALPHRALDVEGLHIVLIILQQRDQGVDRHHDILTALVGRHPRVRHSHAEAQRARRRGRIRGVLDLLGSI